MSKESKDAGFELREGFTVKEHLFAIHFTGKHLGNGTQAAIAAGYSEKSATQAGWETRRKPHVQAFIKELLEEKVMGPEEATARLADIARGSIDTFFSVDDSGRPYLDLSREAAKDNMHLVKTIDQNKFGEWIVTLHDQHSALVNILKVHGKFISKIEHTVFEGEDLSQLTDEELDELDNGKPLDVIIKGKSTE